MTQTLHSYAILYHLSEILFMHNYIGNWISCLIVLVAGLRSKRKYLLK
jgi:hypothetical protein